MLAPFRERIVMLRTLSHLWLAGLVIVIAAGCSTAPKTTSDRSALLADTQHSIDQAKANDPTLKPFFDNSAGYAIFPSVGKGGLVIGGAYGKGVLYERGTPIAYCDLTQASVGLLAGGQAYTELIFFETPQSLADFKSGDFTLSAQATAVALRSGAGANAKYSNSVAVFTMDESGLMGEAALGGQKFSIAPME
jgi:lipid-binding SYLF domain-containing protein